MPELPDVTVYVEALSARIVGATLQDVRLHTPFLLRSVEPPIGDVLRREVTGVSRVGKRIAVDFGELYLVIHLMIAGRLHWSDSGTRAKRYGRAALADFVFSTGTLVLTEAGTSRRASLHVLAGREALRGMDRGGIDVFHASAAQFAARLRSENHTLKRALTDPRLFSGIGNAYSDEIMHRARVSPVRLTSRLSDEEIAAIHEATRSVLREWTERLRAEAGGQFPEGVTAFRPEMAVHGRYGQPCPVCGAPVQRIRYASNETNYCARCQTEGRLLADRALSRLLKSDWPRSLDELGA